MLDYYRLVWPLLRQLDSERAHGLAITALKNHLVPIPEPFGDERLVTQVWGLTFVNPIGLAAGFDKNAEVIDPVLQQGFGFVEVGSVTPKAQSGNPKPRMFRALEDRGVINRLGFNNHGIERVARRLEERLASPSRMPGIVGLNLGKNKDQPDAIADYVAGIERGRDLADYLVINISSPNTPGLRALQSREALTSLVAATRLAADTKPLLVKIAPDLVDDELRDICEVVLEHRIDGLICGNTTLSRDGLKSRTREEQGGLSGEPLFTRSTAVLKRVYELTEGRLPLIGVGGVSTGEQAYAKLRAGASLVQLYTGLVYGGIGLARRIAQELSRIMEKQGVTSVAEVVGADHR
ncbi:MAG: quinone-dependent dihydroorotate dehydrogenase [Myxococcota bacterium]